MLAMAGLLLLIPGFVTDFIGLLLLTPFTRKPVAKVLYKRMQIKVANQNHFKLALAKVAGQDPRSPFGQDPRSPFGQDQGNTFDGDYEHKVDPSDKRPESHQLDDKQDPKA